MTKKKPPFTFKELLFSYLAITKLMYWIGNLAGIDEFGGAVNLVIDRLIVQDIMVIWILIAMFLLDHYVETRPSLTSSIIKRLLTYGLGYIIYIGSIVGYILLLAVLPITDMQGLSQALDFMGEVLIFYSVFFVIACVFLSLKDRMKKSDAEKYIAESEDNTLSLLATLHSRGVLTQSEYESKKAEIEGEMPTLALSEALRPKEKELSQ